MSDHLDAARRQHWLQQEWPRILRAAQRHKGLILFEDEASFAQWGSLSYTWARRGQQPAVKTSGKRKGYKVFGAIAQFIRTCRWLQLIHKDRLAPLANAPFSTLWARKRYRVGPRFRQY